MKTRKRARKSLDSDLNKESNEIAGNLLLSESTEFRRTRSKTKQIKESPASTTLKYFTPKSRKSSKTVREPLKRSNKNELANETLISNKKSENHNQSLEVEADNDDVAEIIYEDSDEEQNIYYVCPTDSERQPGLAFKNNHPDKIHYLGTMDKECENCQALHFSSEIYEHTLINERRIKTYKSCCNYGAIVLNHFRNYPSLLQGLMNGYHPKWNVFMSNIVDYNQTIAKSTTKLKLQSSNPQNNLDPELNEALIKLFNKINPNFGAAGNRSISNEFYDTLNFPVLFPNGEIGWSRQNSINDPNMHISMREYYASMIFQRQNSFNPILNSNKLFEEFVLDCWNRIQANRKQTLPTIMKTICKEQRDYQSQLTFDYSYDYCKDYESFAKYQDAASFISTFGKPDYYLRFFCNPNWKEFSQELRPNQSLEDRPDLVIRVFQLKLSAIINELLNKQVLGEVLGYIYAIDFDDPSRPCCHMLLTVKSEWKIDTRNDIDRVICAELPEIKEEPELFSIVSKAIAQGYRGKKTIFRNETIFDSNGCPIYRRRNDDKFIEFNRELYDNRSVLPYSPYLSFYFNTYVTLEMCSFEMVLDILFKYFYKKKGDYKFNSGNGRSRNNLNNPSVHEAICKIFSFPLIGMSHSFQRLSFARISDLTAWFAINRKCQDIFDNNNYSFPENVIDSRQYYYFQMPEYFEIADDCWKQRLKANRTIGRLFYVNPNDEEMWALRMLLLHSKGACSFADIRTVNGIVYNSFSEAAEAGGYINFKEESLRATLREAVSSFKPSDSRTLFMILLCSKEFQNSSIFWNDFKFDLSSDFIVSSGDHIGEALAFAEVVEKLIHTNVKIEEIVSYSIMRNPVVLSALTPPPIDFEEYALIATDKATMLNQTQIKVFNEILSAAKTLSSESKPANSKAAKSFFIDGCACTGKTFILEVLYYTLMSKRIQTQFLSPTEVGSYLFPGGQTLSSVFGEPEAGEFELNPKTKSKILTETDVFLLDDAHIITAKQLEIMDHTLKNITKINKMFGGKMLILCGNFLQVITRDECMTDRREQVKNCLKNSLYWKFFEHRALDYEVFLAGHAISFKRFLKKKLGEKYMLNKPCAMRCPVRNYCLPGQFIEQLFGPEFQFFPPEHNIVAICPKRIDALRLNEEIISQFPGDKCVITSVDKLLYETHSDAYNLPPEIFYHFHSVDVPPHKLELKIGCIVLLLKNINLKEGLFKGARLIVHEISSRLLTCGIISGPRKGSIVLLPKMNFIVPLKDSLGELQLSRRQFPVCLGFAIGVHQTHGQIFEKTGIWMADQFYSHGQLYQALSRVKKESQFVITSENSYMTNVVFEDVL